MIRTHLKTLIITSLLILLPIPAGLLLWDRFPTDVMPSQLWTVWAMPLSMLAAHWFCVLATALDPGHEGRNKKPLKMVLWIIPATTWFCCGLTYALYMGLNFSMVSWTLVLMALMFIVIGNYMPKTKMNHTLGIKVYWAYTSEENWEATHRFAGRLWVIGGIVMLLGIFLPEGAAIALMVLDMIVLIALPIIYSWRFWKKQKAEGAALQDYRRINPKLTKMGIVLLVALLVFVVAVMFVGDIEYTFENDGFTIVADWYGDMTVQYDAIQSMEYRNEDVPGIRVGGFGSLRLLMGYFKNEEFGTHLRYTYYKPESCIVLKTDRHTIVLSGKTAADTQALYDTLIIKLG